MKILLFILPSFFFTHLLIAEITKESPTELTFRQPNGIEICIKKFPRRVVIGYRSFAAIWEQSGGRAIGIMGGKDDSILPKSMCSLPRIGSGMTPNLEKILLLEPDLVLFSAQIMRHREAAQRLREANIPVLCLNADNYQDYQDLLELFTHLNQGKAAAEIPQLQKISHEIDAICRNSRKYPPLCCAILFATANGFSLESEKTHAGMILKMLGANNIRTTQEPHRIPFSYESFLLSDPEVIFIITMGNAEALRTKFRNELMSRPSWKALRAAKSGRVYFLDSELFLYQPGPRFPEAFQLLSDQLHPKEKQ